MVYASTEQIKWNIHKHIKQILFDYLMAQFQDGNIIIAISGIIVSSNMLFIWAV